MMLGQLDGGAGGDGNEERHGGEIHQCRMCHKVLSTEKGAREHPSRYCGKDRANPNGAQSSNGDGRRTVKRTIGERDDEGTRDDDAMKRERNEAEVRLRQEEAALKQREREEAERQLRQEEEARNEQRRLVEEEEIRRRQEEQEERRRREEEQRLEAERRRVEEERQAEEARQREEQQRADEERRQQQVELDQIRQQRRQQIEGSPYVTAILGDGIFRLSNQLMGLTKDAARREGLFDEVRGVLTLPADVACIFEQQETLECIICLGAAPDTAAVPCGQRHFCKACADDHMERAQQNGRPAKCPSCREPVEKMIKIYL